MVKALESGREATRLSISSCIRQDHSVQRSAVRQASHGGASSALSIIHSIAFAHLRLTLGVGRRRAVEHCDRAKAALVCAVLLEARCVVHVCDVEGSRPCPSATVTLSRSQFGGVTGVRQSTLSAAGATNSLQPLASLPRQSAARRAKSDSIRPNYRSPAQMWASPGAEVGAYPLFALRIVALGSTGLRQLVLLVHCTTRTAQYG